jgi:hypothetical protein
MLQSHDAASAAIGSTVYAPQSGHTSLCYDLCVAKSGTLDLPALLRVNPPLGRRLLDTAAREDTRNPIYEYT